MTITLNAPCWFDKENESMAAELVFGQMNFIDENSTYQTDKNLRNVRLYGDMTIVGLAPYNYVSGSNNSNSSMGPTRITLNVIQSCIDTLTSKLGKQKIKPTFITKGGDYYAQKKAKQLDKFLFGLFHKLNLSKKAREALKDALIIGTGSIRVYREDNEVKLERVFCQQLKIDDLEAFTSNPRTLYYYKYVDRRQLADQYSADPDSTVYDAIMKAPSAAADHGYRSMNNLIMVIEAWHLPSGPGRGDGRHCICVDQQVLLYEDYTRETFPFAFIKYTELPLGFWGRGIADQLSSIQMAINRFIYNVQQAMALSASPKVLISNEAEIPAGIVNNEIAGIIRYKGGFKPEYIAPQPINPAVMNFVDNLYQKAYEICGISRLSAQSSKPAGLDSGKALREFSDIESERFIAMGQDYEQFHIDLAYIIIEEVQDIVKDTGTYKALSYDKKHGVEPIDLKDIGPIDDFIIQVFPGSQLSQTPAGKKQDVMDLIQSGMIPPEFALDLLDMPDLDTYKSLKSASMNIIEKTLTKIQEDEKYFAPEPFYDLKLAKSQGQMYYLRSQVENAPEAVQALFVQWIDDCQQLIEAMEAGVAQPQPVAQPGTAQAAAPGTPADIAAQFPGAQGIAAPALT